jgi:hypothetical protein
MFGSRCCGVCDAAELEQSKCPLVKLVSFGVLFGVSTALAMTRFMSSLPFGVTRSRLRTFSCRLIYS